MSASNGSSVNIRVARIIAGSLTAGPVLAWIVAWWLLGEGGFGADGRTAGSEVGEVLVWAWIAVALPAFAIGLYFRGRALSLVSEARMGSRPDPDEASAGPARLQSLLVIAWSMFEGPALFSAVAYLLTGAEALVWAGAALLAVGMFLSFPRREWFDAVA